MSSRPKAKVWNEDEGCFTNNEENGLKANSMCPDKDVRAYGMIEDRNRRRGPPQSRGRPPQGRGGRPQGRGGPPQGHGGPPQGRGGPPQGRGGPPQGRGGPPQGQNRGRRREWDQSRDYQDTWPEEGYTEGEGQQRRNDRGQNQRYQNFRGQNQGQQNRGQNQGQHNRQNYGQSQRENSWDFERGRGQGNQGGQRHNQGQQGRQGQHQQGGLLPEPEQQPYSYPPPNMQYPPMMAAPPMYQPVMMQPMVPMYPMHPQPPYVQPMSPPQPQPLMDVQTENYRGVNKRGQGRQNFARGRPQQRNSDVGGNMSRSSSMRSVDSIGSQSDDWRDYDERNSNYRGRGANFERGRPPRGNRNYRGRGGQNSDRLHAPRGNMARSSSTMSVDDIGSHQEESHRHNDRHRNDRGRKGSNRSVGNNSVDEKFPRSSSVTDIDNIGRDQGARPKQPKNVGGRSNDSSTYNNAERNNDRNQNKQEGRIRGRGRGRGKEFLGRDRPINKRNTSVSDDTDQKSVCSISDDSGDEGEKIQGHLYNKIRGRLNARGRTRGRDTRNWRFFRGRGSVPFRGRPWISRQGPCDIAGTPPCSSPYNEDAYRFNPRGNFRGFVRGRGSFRGGRGRFFRGRWSGFVGGRKNMKDDESKEDSSSTVAQDDFDDAMSTASDVSFAPSSIADDISESGLTDGNKYEICLDDIHTVKLVTLRNRVMRYKKRLADMRRKNEDKDEIKNYQDRVDEIRKVLKEREPIKEQVQKRNGDDGKAKGAHKVQKHDKKNNTEKNVSTSDDSEEEMKRKQILSKSKRMHSVLAVKGHVSFKPKSRKKTKGNPSIKKNAEESFDTDSEEEVEDNINYENPVMENTDRNEGDQKKKKRIRNRNRRQKISSENKKEDSGEKEKLLTDILSKLDSLTMGQQSSKLETKQEDTPGSCTDGSADSRSRGNSMNDYDISSKVHHPDKNISTKAEDTTERLRKTSESNVQGPDVNEVFKFMVKTLEGKGTPEEIKRESGLFPIDCEEIAWFRKFKRRFTLIERNGTVEVVLVSNRDATYCLDYITNRSCKKEDCKRYHICKHLLAGNCVYGDGCKFSHNLLDERNISISKRLGYSNVFTNDEIRSILKVRYPHTCHNWMEYGVCDDTHCISLHLCQRYILGQCLEGEQCPLVHDKCSGHNKPIVDAYGMAKWIENVFKKMIYMTRQPDIETREDEEKSDRPVPVVEKTVKSGRERRASFDKERNKTEKQEEKEESAIDKPICERYLTGNCRRQRCKFLHCKTLLPYIWQVKLCGTWINLNAMEEIEKAFSNNGDFSEEIRLVLNDMEFSVVVIFRPQIRAIAIVIGTQDGGTHAEARRLSTMSYKAEDNNSDSFKTQWRWYWRDDRNRWLLFEPDAMQHTLEVKFLAKQQEFNYSRENYRFKYILDFNEMAQRNIETRKRREICRRPVFVSVEDVKGKHCPKSLTAAPVVETTLPQSWVPWDLAFPFELVKIDESDPTHAKVSDSFFKTLDRGLIEIDAIFRMQNHKLWSLYYNQEKIMEANLKRLGKETAVDKRYLFHGTDSLDAVRGISINNFDVRVSGKNATMYGDGAYFARDAKYSHSYTKGPERFMFMVTVLVGQYTKGERAYRRPPNKPGSDHELYDSCVDNMDNPAIFIVFDKNQYYPEYLIQYHKLYEEPEITQQASYRSTTSPATGSVGSSAARQPGVVGSSAARQPGAVGGVNASTAHTIYSRRVPSSSPDPYTVNAGYTASQNSGRYSPPYSPHSSTSSYGSDYTTVRAPTARSPVKDPISPKSPKKKDDSSCCIQ